MKSEARERLHQTFNQVPVGTTFQLVNRLMHAALPQSRRFLKVSDSEAKHGERVFNIAPSSKIEIVRGPAIVAEPTLPS